MTRNDFKWWQVWLDGLLLFSICIRIFAHVFALTTLKYYFVRPSVLYVNTVSSVGDFRTEAAANFKIHTCYLELIGCVMKWMLFISQNGFLECWRQYLFGLVQAVSSFLVTGGEGGERVEGGVGVPLPHHNHHQHSWQEKTSFFSPCICSFWRSLPLIISNFPTFPSTLRTSAPMCDRRSAS